ncbi:MAG: protein BatD [Deltaproteobacteria bacterium]|uniref:Protein BatD n=1 Tax=Candidatus Desulfacyla euxinica TaxID=2841693 RepID=A0A8J6T4U6_9DELT|nr:protein BatD [Candidatus Desulfacyla euxinica]
MKNHGAERVKAIGWNWFMIAGTCFMVAACAFILFAGSAQGKGPAGGISARLEPQQITLGDAAVLAVNISGEQTGPPSISPVDGLRFFPMGQSSQYQSINGKTSSTVSYLYQVQAEGSGNYTIPPVRARINGQVRKTEPISLRVSGSGGSRSLGATRLPPSAPNIAKQTATSSFRAGEDNQITFLRVTPSKYRSYVGELVPVRIEAFFRQGLQARLNSFPVLSNNAFACQGLNKKPTQTEEIVDGVPFAVLTWHTAMSAVKEGEHPVSAELDATLIIPQTSRRRNRVFGNSMFNDDFFNNFFNTTREETVKLTSSRQKMRVLPLPKAGRPENFSGAVGRFKLWASASLKSCMVGDPITLKMTVKGDGNFDRVSSPLLTSTDQWKTYTPISSFKPADSSGYKGKKRFEQAIIPLDASINKVPPLTFSYFDTRKEKYVTLRTRPIKVKITADTRQARVSSAKNSDGNKPPIQSSDSSGLNKNPNGLAPIHVGLGPVTASLTPIFENPWFIGTQGIPLGALFIGLFLGRRNRRLSNDPAILKQKHVKQKINKSIKEMDRTIAGHDVPGFFSACRCTVQERLGEIWSQAPESITLAEVKDRLSKNAAGVRHVFENADAVAYSGQTFNQEELKKFRDLIIKELKNLEN